MAQVNLSNVVKTYGPVRAVDGVSLSIADKEFVTLVGPSGCGKTTTLHMIAGLIELDGGEIWIGDKNVGDLDPKDRDIAMVFQNYALYPHKSVKDNLAFPLRMRKIAADKREAKIAAAARILSIEALLERKPKQLSGGQQQRVALGRAIVRDPAVFLMDEPLSNLDAKLRVQMRTEIKHLQKSLQATMIYVTHDQMEAMTMSDKIAIMDKGKVMQFGSPDDVFNHPANLFVAGFIGSPPMNLVPATINDGKLALGGNTITPSTSRLQNLVAAAPAKEVVLGFRHSTLRMVPTGTPNTLTCSIYTVEPTGDTTFVQTRLGDTLCTLSNSDPGYRGNFNDPLHLLPDEDRLYLFDTASGLAITK